MPYFANFQKTGSGLFRFDTRIYLNDSALPRTSDVCVAAIVGKNPGSATVKPGGTNQLARLTLGKDKMLPTVRNVFRRAYSIAGKNAPEGAYVIVWNLFYLCEPNLPQAICAYRKMASSLQCPTENSLRPGIVWYAWGPSHPILNTLKGRFNRPAHVSFFYDYRAKVLQSQIPSVTDLAKHPQGLKMSRIEPFLASIL
jgi:hypothetical protein